MTRCTLLTSSSAPGGALGAHAVWCFDHCRSLGWGSRWYSLSDLAFFHLDWYLHPSLSPIIGRNFVGGAFLMPLITSSASSFTTFPGSVSASLCLDEAGIPFVVLSFHVSSLCSTTSWSVVAHMFSPLIFTWYARACFQLPAEVHLFFAYFGCASWVCFCVRAQECLPSGLQMSPDSLQPLLILAPRAFLQDGL